MTSRCLPGPTVRNPSVSDKPSTLPTSLKIGMKSLCYSVLIKSCLFHFPCPRAGGALLAWPRSAFRAWCPSLWQPQPWKCGTHSIAGMGVLPWTDLRGSDRFQQKTELISWRTGRQEEEEKTGSPHPGQRGIRRHGVGASVHGAGLFGCCIHRPQTGPGISGLRHAKAGLAESMAAGQLGQRELARRGPGRG